MQLGFDVQIPDGLLAANALLAENSRQGFATGNRAPYQGLNRANCTAALGLSWSVASGTCSTHLTGRWMLPDWSATPAAVPYADLKEPQTLNLYTYVGNDPINKEDKDGHDCCDWSAIGDYAVGILRGAVSSLSYGYAGAPKVSDSTASLAGQTFGTTAVALEGTQMTATGGGEILAGGGVTPVAALGVVTASGGAAITVGAAQNAGAIANVVAMMAPKVGESGGPGGGKDFSRGTKKQAVQENQSANEGQSKCVFCSEKVGDGTGNKINIDHAQAKSENGNNGLKNANVTCEYCNKSKGTGPAPKNPKLPN